jgi:MFS family permease
MNRPFAALLVALFAGGVAAAPIRAFLPIYVESVLKQPPLLTSTVLAIQTGCGGLFALAGGAVSDLVSRRAAVLVGMTTAIFGAALFVVHAPVALFGLAILWGIAGGFQSAGGQSFLIAAVSKARLGSASAVYFISSTAAGALGAYIAGRAADRYGFSAVTAGAVALAVIALALAARFLPPLGSDKRAERAANHSWTFAGYLDLLARSDVRALAALRYFPTVAWGCASLAIPLLVFRASGSKSTVGTYSMISLLAASLAQLATGREIDRRAKRIGAPALRAMVAPIAAAILLCAVAATAWSGGLVGLFVAGTAWAMTAWALSTTMPPLIHELGVGRDDGRLVALMHLCWSAGMLTGTLAAGALIDWRPSAPFALAAACLVVAFGVGLRFPALLHHSADVSRAAQVEIAQPARP